MTVGYAYYRDFFGGATVLEEEFPIFEKKACAYIRYLTSGRSDSIVMDAVKDAVCAVCEVYAAERSTGAGTRRKPPGNCFRKQRRLFGVFCNRKPGGPDV